jgi:hypothetical protein
MNFVTLESIFADRGRRGISIFAKSMTNFQLHNNHSSVNWYLVAVKDSGYWHHAIDRFNLVEFRIFSF